MLTHEVMGVFALGVLWLNTLLVVLAALVRARDLLARRARLRPLDPERPEGHGLVRGRIEGPAGAPPAELAIEQVGRYGAGSKRTILWHDRAHASTVRASKLILDGDVVIEVDGAAAEAEVWLDAGVVDAAAACDGAGEFDAAYPAARKARGTARTVKATIASGTDVWVAGTLRRSDGGLALGPAPGAPLVVATIDPRAWLAGRASWLIAFAPIALALCAACTGVALWPPVFDGWISKVGGLLCFVYFLLVLPAGTRMRDLTAIPSVRALRGRWDARGPAGEASAAAAP